MLQQQALKQVLDDSHFTQLSFDSRQAIEKVLKLSLPAASISTNDARLVSDFVGDHNLHLKAA